jgi:hypothetical protein
MRGFIIFTLHQLLLGWSNQGGWDRRVCSAHEGDDKFCHYFVRKVWTEKTTRKTLEPSGPTNGGEFLDDLSDCQLLKKGSSFLWPYSPWRTLAASHIRGFLSCLQMVGFLGLVISSSQGLYLHRTTQHRRTRTNIYALSGIRTHDPSNQPRPTPQTARSLWPAKKGSALSNYLLSL